MTTESKPKRPPNDRGQGRKPKPVEELKVVVPIRLSPKHKAKLKALGGVEWVRAKLDAEAEPKA